MLLGLPSGAFHRLSSGVQEILRAIEEIESIGFPLVELHSDVEAFYPGRLKVVAINAKRSLKYTVHLPFVDPSPGSPIKEMREATESIIARVIEAVSVLDPIHYVFHPLNLAEERALMTMFDQRELERLEERVVEMHEIIGDYAGVHGRVLIENMERLPIDRRLEYLEGYGFYGCLDVGHAVLQGRDPVKILEDYGKYIREIHLHDVLIRSRAHGTIKVDHLPPGVGVVSFNEIIEVAQELKIPVVIIEVYNPQHAYLAAERAKKRGLIRRAS